MFRSVSRKIFFCSMATVMCTASTVMASAGAPIFSRPNTSSQSNQDDFQPIADNNSYQSNPYSQDENNYNPVYVQPVGVGVGVGTGLGTGAGLNDRAAAEAAERNRRALEERGGALNERGGEEGRGMGERGMGERGGMERRGGRR